MQNIDVDVAIVGSGFAGSLTALALRRRGMTRRARRAGTSSAVRHRRIVHAAREPSDRGVRRSLRPAARPGVLEVGNLAGSTPGSRRRPQTRFHVPVPSCRRAFLGRPRPRAPIAGRRKPARRDRRHALVPAGLRSRARPRGQREGAIYLDETRLERVRDEDTGVILEGTPSRPRPPILGAVPDRRQRPARIPSPRLRPRGRSPAVAAADASALHAFRRCRALGPPDDSRRRAAVPAGRCGGASRV